MLKQALRLMAWYRLKIEEVLDGQSVTSYTRWVDAVQVRGAEDQQVYLTMSPRFEGLWLECKKHLLDYLAQKPAAIGLRSQNAIRLYAWANDHLSAGTRRITLERLRKMLGLDSVRTSIIFDFNGRVIIPWSVRRIGALGDNTVELLSDMPDPLLDFAQVLRAS